MPAREITDQRRTPGHLPFRGGRVPLVHSEGNSTYPLLDLLRLAQLPQVQAVLDLEGSDLLPADQSRRYRQGRQQAVKKKIARYGSVDLLCIDELGYMELDRRGAELLFQVLTDAKRRTAWPSPPTSRSRLDQDLHRPTPARPSLTALPSTAPSSRSAPTRTALPAPEPALRRQPGPADLCHYLPRPAVLAEPSRSARQAHSIHRLRSGRFEA